MSAQSARFISSEHKKSRWERQISKKEADILGLKKKTDDTPHC
jgi:hypothetical protein